MSFRRFFLVRLGWALLGLWLAVTIVFVITRVVVSPRETCYPLLTPRVHSRAARR